MSGKEIDELGRAIANAAMSNVLYIQKYSKYGGYDGFEPIYTPDIAKHLYSAGYRKQRYGENLTENHPVDEFICSECGLITRENTRIEIDEDADGDEEECEFEIKYCPRCGMKVKGGGRE
jgi:hypothetical protein